MDHNRQCLLGLISGMDAEQLDLLRIAIKAVTTLPPDQAAQFHDLAVNEGVSIQEAAARFGLQSEVRNEP